MENGCGGEIPGSDLWKTRQVDFDFYRQEAMQWLAIGEANGAPTVIRSWSESRSEK